jgi:anti-anti-sigma factor
MTGLTIQRRQQGNVGVLTLQGDVSAELIPQLQAAAQAAVQAGAKHLLVNLHELGFMDSASLGALLHLGQARAKQAGRLVLRALAFVQAPDRGLGPRRSVHPGPRRAERSATPGVGRTG